MNLFILYSLLFLLLYAILIINVANKSGAVTLKCFITTVINQNYFPEQVMNILNSGFV